MITKDNLHKVLDKLGFVKSGALFLKHFSNHGCDIQVNFSEEKIVYPSNLDTGANTTTNFSQPENFVVLECVCRLLEKGYEPQTIFLEKSWTVGHTGTGGRADITVYDKDENGDPHQAYLIIECKRAGKDYKDARKEMFEDPDGKQLFSYWTQARSAKWLQLYASDYDDDKDEITFQEEVVRSYDDENVEALAREDSSVLIFKNASTAQDAFIVWDETYSKKVYDNNIIFGNDATAYKIGNLPIKSSKLKPFRKEDGITDAFREILRHNSISDKENAFNKLLSLFICKFVDEEMHNDPDDIMYFQYVDGSDNYYKLYERLLGLFQIGMKDFLKEDVFYLENDYIRKTLDQFTGKRRNELEKELVDKFQKTKMLSCQVFAFREVYNEKLFLQNGKVLVEVVELFQNYRMAYTSKEQVLGDLFENLLNQGFKQEAGQFFTPIPITRFVWNSLPIERFLDENKLTVPRVVDFACGSGHFLTEGISAISDFYNNGKETPVITDKAISKSFFGVDKDNRLARVSKVAMLLNGANDANIMAADGLEHDENFYQGGLNSFDVLVANPPYSVGAFKGHESRKVQNAYETIKLMSFTCKDIQNVFIERMHHLLKPKGVAGIVMPSSILNGTDNASIKTREIILQHFHVRAIASFAGKTFGETNTSTIILFLEHVDFPPQKAQMLKDSVAAILNNEELTDWDDKDIFENYLRTINVEQADYNRFIRKEETLFENTFAAYFKEYEKVFLDINDVKKALGKIAETEKKECAGVALKKNEKTSVAQKADLNNGFYSFVREIEYQKLLYFALTYKEQTLLITAPTEINEQKKFLGYDFSHRRGDEGIKETEGLLSSPSKRNDESKLAWFVRKAFDGEQFTNEELGKYVNYAHTADLLSFTRPSFDLQMKVAVEKKIDITSIFPLETVRNLLMSIDGNTTKIEKNEIKEEGKYPVITQETENFISGYTDNENAITDLPLIVFGDHSCTLKYVDFPFVRGADGTQLLKTNQEKVLTKYLYYFLQNVEIENSGKYERHFKYLKERQIPVPENIVIQQQIVSECEKIDEEYANAQKWIEESKNEIGMLVKNAKGDKETLKQIAPYSTRRISFSDVETNEYISTDNMLQNCEGVRAYNGEPNVDSVIEYLENDILVSNIRPYLKKIWFANRTGGCSPDVLVFRVKDKEKYDAHFVYYALAQDSFFEHMMLGAKGMKMPRGDKNSILEYEIPVPPIEEQQKIVKQIETFEAAVAEAKAVMDSCAERKKMVLEKWMR
ncbi:MAG: restriction endonuclease subunit S [Bacteroidales bacterium]|nr:restriction endonuclease subunit S [Bacteroidales bacterium]